MKSFKNYSKLTIGIAVLVLVMIGFVLVMQPTDLENGSLRDWLSASESRRITAVKILDGADENTEIMSSCISQMASLPDSGKIKVKDAASLCALGIALKNNITSE